MPKHNIQKPTDKNSRSIFTPLEEAVLTIKERRKDTELMKRVHDYLAGDIPKHFDREEPILYLSRHIATPNYESLRFVELGKPHNLPLVIGQDSKGKFVSHNEIKRPLGKMPVTKGFSRRLDEIVENFTVVDFSLAQGKSFNEIKTKRGADLVSFHNELFAKIYPTEIEVAEESDWIDRNHRHDLFEQYKRMLSLMCAHGIMLESYPESDRELLEAILIPAIADIEEKIGCRPLIVEHIDPELELTRDWNGYPSVLYQYIKQHLEG
jgi:hypothetical protein